MHQSFIYFVKIRGTENKREGFTGSYKHVNGFQSIKEKRRLFLEYSLCNNKKSLIVKKSKKLQLSLKDIQSNKSL